MTVGEKILKEADNLECSDPQFVANHRAFWEMYEELLKTYEGQWVAVHEGQVVDADSDMHALVERVWTKYGHDKHIYFQEVLREGMRIVEAPI